MLTVSIWKIFELKLSDVAAMSSSSRGKAYETS
jgi:hypothetical protein